MTELNIEQERREFFGVSKAFAESVRGMDVKKEETAFREFAAAHYPNGRRLPEWEFDMCFAAWLAAKRAAQGSAEPVGYLATRDIDGLKDPRFASAGVVLTKYASSGRVAVYTATPAPVSAEPVAREAIRLAVQRITEIQKRDGGRAWQEAKSILFGDLTFVVQELIDALAKLPPNVLPALEARPCACVGVETGTRCLPGCEDGEDMLASAPPSTDAKDGQIEIAAQAIYTRWRDHPEFVEWIVRGNSHKQDEARALARAALEAIAAKEAAK